MDILAYFAACLIRLLPLLLLWSGIDAVAVWLLPFNSSLCAVFSVVVSVLLYIKIVRGTA